MFSRVSAACAPLVAVMIVMAGCLGGLNEGLLGKDAIRVDGLPALTEVHALWSVHHINATVEHDPANKHAKSVTTMVIENEHTAALPYFHVYTLGMEVTSITLPDGTPVAYEREGETEAAIPIGSLLFDFPTYNVTIPGNSEPGATHTLVITAEGWEEIAFYGGGSVGGDVPASDLNAFPQLAIVPIPDTMSVPTFTVTYTRPADWTYVLSAFPVTDAIEAGGKLTQTFSVKSVYMLTFVAKDLPAIHETVDGVEVVTHYHPDMLAQAQAVHAATKRALRVVPLLTGPYPYPSITTVPVKMPVNAFSTPGVNALGLNFYRTTLPNVPHQFGRFTPWAGGGEQYELVIVHEFTHNWWGHEIANNNSDPNKGLNDHYITEGFTTYLSEIAYYEFAYGERDAAASMESKWRDQQEARATGTESPVTERGDYYEKTALALRVLHAHYRFAGKEDAFLQTFRNIQQEYGLANGGPGILRHEEVVGAFSKTYGEDLTGFFRTWLETTDLPDVAVAEADATGATIANLGKVGVPVEVRFLDARGNENMTVHFLEAGDRVRLDPQLPFPLVSVHADPDWRLDEVDKANNVWGAASPVVPPVQTL